MSIANEQITLVKSNRVCFVTGEFIGPRKCGGMGTATTGLALFLASIGHEVTVFYTRGYLMTRAQISHWQSHYKGVGINFVPLEAKHIGKIIGPLFDLTYFIPTGVFNYLSDQEFDIVHFNDLEADGYLSIAAKRTGLAFQNSVLALTLHSPRAWIEAINKESLQHQVAVAMDAAERFCISNCDVLFSPSQYLLNWIRDRGFSTPRNTIVQQYVLPTLSSSRSNVSSKDIKRLVFFGRIEARKGIFQFLNALDLLKEKLVHKNVEVAFLGTNTLIGGKASEEIIKERAQAWNFKWQNLGALGHTQALNYLQQPGQLAVMASLEDNSPCTLYEAMELGIPFIAAATGGIPELISKDQTEDVLFEPTANALAGLLSRAIDKVPSAPKAAIPRFETARQWQRLHTLDADWIKDILQPDAFENRAANYGVVIEASRDNGDLAITLKSLERFSKKPTFVLVIADNGLVLTSPYSFDTVPKADLLEWLSRLDQKDADLLLIHAGLALDEDSVEKLVANRKASSSCLVLPTIEILEGQINAPVISVAMGFVMGSAPTGAAFLTAKLKTESIDTLKGFTADIEQNMFSGLVDAALCIAGEAIPYPHPIGKWETDYRSLPKQMQNPVRLNLFTKLAAKQMTDIRRLAAIQTLGARYLDRRTILAKLLRSRFAFFIPYLERLNSRS